MLILMYVNSEMVMEILKYNEEYAKTNLFKD